MFEFRCEGMSLKRIRFCNPTIVKSCFFTCVVILSCETPTRNKFSSIAWGLNALLFPTTLIHVLHTVFLFTRLFTWKQQDTVRGTYIGKNDNGETVTCIVLISSSVSTELRDFLGKAWGIPLLAAKLQ